MNDLREKIARLRFDSIKGLDPEWDEIDDTACPGLRDSFRAEADAILALVRDHLTSDVAVERALETWFEAKLDPWTVENLDDMRAAILAAL